MVGIEPSTRHPVKVKNRAIQYASAVSVSVLQVFCLNGMARAMACTPFLLGDSSV
jgi:hypothetical protein